MAQEIGGTPAREDEHFQARIDQLLSGALQEQAQEDKELLDSVRRARTDLTRVMQELTAVRHLVEHPNAAGLEALQKLIASAIAQIGDIPSHIRGSSEAYSAAIIKKMLGESAQLQGALQASAIATGERIGFDIAQLRESLSSIQGLIETRLEAGQKLLEARAEAMTQAVTSRLVDMEESLGADIEVAQEAILEHITGSHGEAAEASVEEIKKLKAFIATGITSVVTKAIGPFVEIMGKLEARIEHSDQRINLAVDQIASMQSTLIRYLGDRDQKMEEQRDRALLDLVDKMSDSLTRRQRGKIAVAVRDAQKRTHDEGATGKSPGNFMTPVDSTSAPVPAEDWFPAQARGGGFEKPLPKDESRPGYFFPGTGQMDEPERWPIEIDGEGQLIDPSFSFEGAPSPRKAATKKSSPKSKNKPKAKPKPKSRPKAAAAGSSRSNPSSAGKARSAKQTR